MSLMEQIIIAMREHDTNVRACESYKTKEAKQFIIKQVHWATDNLLNIAKEIRANNHLRKWSKHGRVPDNILNEMLAIGQHYANFLSLAKLRGKVVEPIEYHYGVNFSGLKIYSEFADKREQSSKIFLLYSPRWFNSIKGNTTGDNHVTITKNGELCCITSNEFDANYVAITY